MPLGRRHRALDGPRSHRLISRLDAAPRWTAPSWELAPREPLDQAHRRLTWLARSIKKAVEGWDQTQEVLGRRGLRDPPARPRSRRSGTRPSTSSVRLGVNPKYADQMVRGSVVMPAGTGKTKRVLVIAKPEKAKEALEAGADYAGSRRVHQEDRGGELVRVRHPGRDPGHDGPGRQDRPRPRSARPDAEPEGRHRHRRTSPRRSASSRPAASSSASRRPASSRPRSARRRSRPRQLAANLNALLDTLMKLKPATAKGTYMQSITISTTHGPGIKVDTAAYQPSRAPTNATTEHRTVRPIHTTPVEEAGEPRRFEAPRRRVVDSRHVRCARPLCSAPSTRGFDAFRRRDTMDRAGKEQMLGEIKEAFANVASVVIADYRGIRSRSSPPCATTSARPAATTACSRTRWSRSRSRARTIEPLRRSWPARPR